MHDCTSDRRVLDKLVRDLMRMEADAIERAPREARRIGDATPVDALRAVAAHAAHMRPRLAVVLDGHGVAVTRRALTATLTTLRQLVADRVYDAERAYRAALVELRDGIEIVRALRDVARGEQLFALIRWCDDWLRARRTLVARVEAQLDWFATPRPTPDLADPQR